MMKIALLLTLFSFSALACEISRMDNLNLAISLKDNSFFSYVADQTLQKIPYIRATNCTEASMSSKFLMVAFGPEIVELEDNFRGVNFNGEYKDSRCQLKDAPFAVTQPFSERLKRFNQKWKFIKSCVEVWVEDEGPQPLSAPAVQPGCQMTRFGKQKAMFNGGYCYFKPSFGSSYIVKLSIKDECLSQAGLIQKEIETFDFNSAVNFYLSGDATGNSINLKALSNTVVRISVNPEEKIIPPSDDFGILYPTFPIDWKIPDLHLGTLKLTELYEGRAKIQHSFLVDNNCPKTCLGDFCQSKCDYAQPVVADVSLYKLLPNNKKELITTWYEGGIAVPNFQGFISGIRFEISGDALEVGATYQTVASFTDPKFDFERFKKRVQNSLNTIDQQLGRITRSNIPGVQEIPSILSNREFPVFAGIPNIIFDRSLDSVAQAVATLRSYFSFKVWPPYFSRACGERECLTMRDDLVSLQTTFTLGDIDPESKDYAIKIIETKRKSAIMPEYDYQNPKPAYVDCSF